MLHLGGPPPGRRVCGTALRPGTPISPVFPDLEFLVHHIITQGDDLGNKWPPNAVNLIIKDRYIPTSGALAYRV